MKEDFEEWAKGKIPLSNYDGEYATLEAQIAWQAWQRAWNIAIREQRRKDDEEITALKNKLKAIAGLTGTKFLKER
jgi:hypothetical protein